MILIDWIAEMIIFKYIFLIDGNDNVVNGKMEDFTVSVFQFLRLLNKKYSQEFKITSTLCWSTINTFFGLTFIHWIICTLLSSSAPHEICFLVNKTQTVMGCNLCVCVCARMFECICGREIFRSYMIAACECEIMRRKKIK